jgi:hypothetical protein
MVDQPLIDAVEWSVNLSFWAAIAFPFVIGTIWFWWLDWWGQNMIAFDLCFAGAALPLVLRYDFGVKASALAWVDVISLSLVTLVVIHRAVMIFVTQRRKLPAQHRSTPPLHDDTQPIP